MLEFIWQYLVGPIVAEAIGEPATWQGVEAVAGYNPFNTVLWALLAVAVLLGVQKLFSRKNIQFTPETSVKLLPLILLAGTLRFTQDALDLNFWIEILLITPIIYVWMAGLAITLILLESNKPVFKYANIVFLAAIPLLLLITPDLDYLIIIGITTVSGLGAALYYLLTQDTEFQAFPLVLAAWSQIFEAFSSSYAVTQGYEPRQLLTSASVDLFGPLGFLLVKLGILGLALKVYFDLETEWQSILLIVLYSIGFATGLRVLLRASAGI